MEQEQEQEQELKYRIYWKSFRTTEYFRSPFVFDKKRALKTINSMEAVEHKEEAAHTRLKKHRSKFYILPDTDYLPIEIALIPICQSPSEYKKALNILAMKDLI